MEISIKESTMVRPAEEHTPKGSIWNSNLDLLISRYHVSTVYFYKPNGCSDFFDTGRVKEGLSKVLVPFYPIAGRLGVKEGLSKVLVPFYPIAGRLGYDENGRLEIICNDEGVPFVEAETSSVLEDLVGNGDFTHNSHLVPKVDYSGGISSYPLLVVQLIYFEV
ncbi:hypothetical protein GOBAR_DD36862 [Gossypium barbadense]|nr:hypothetical protein GOBAR_DD36862 [Gossypium barbadense]